MAIHLDFPVRTPSPNMGLTKHPLPDIVAFPHFYPRFSWEISVTLKRLPAENIPFVKKVFHIEERETENNRLKTPWKMWKHRLFTEGFHFVKIFV
jgi:hypothetical protein